MNPKRSFFARLLRDERGAAVAMILLIGSVLVVLTGVIVTRGVRQVGNTAGDADWEQSLNVAEAGMEFAINSLNNDGDFTTGETVPAFDRAVTSIGGDSVSLNLTISPDPNDCTPGEPVTASAEYEFSFIALPFANITLDSEAVMRCGG